jgi:hypothetical protein
MRLVVATATLVLTDESPAAMPNQRRFDRFV